MSIKEQLKAYINSQPAPKREDMKALHEIIMELMPGTRLWFLDGKNSDNKTVSNPNIGYGQFSIKYADGKTKDFYQVGLSANTSGISIYIMGLKDKKQLAAAFGEKIGKASVTGYCIKFKQVKDINIAILKDAILYGIGESGSE